MPVKAPIVGFLQSARRAGLRISVAESLDAFAALDTVGYDDRALLKESLGLVLAKTAGDKRLFDACFERYFSRDGFVDLPPEITVPDFDPSADPLLSSLALMLLAGDRAATARQ